MKSTFLKSKILVLALFAITLTSCSEDGTDGIDGIEGATGATGADGNANVISSGWINYDDTLWGDMITAFGIDQRIYPVEISDLTEEMVDTAVVLMYTRFSDALTFASTSSYMLPFTEGITKNGDTEVQEISFKTRPTGGGIDIRMVNTDFTGDPGTFGGVGIEYRYIIIPATELVSAKSSITKKAAVIATLEAAGVNVNNYDEVIAYYGLN